MPSADVVPFLYQDNTVSAVHFVAFSLVSCLLHPYLDLDLDPGAVSSRVVIWHVSFVSFTSEPCLGLLPILWLFSFYLFAGLSKWALITPSLAPKSAAALWS